MPSAEFESWVLASNDRFPQGFVERRLDKEHRKANSVFSSETSFVGRFVEPRFVLNHGLRISGLRSRGIRNAVGIQLVKNTITLPDMPADFDGFSILQITDPHFNNHQGFVDRLLSLIRQTHYDLCVLTGDYRYRSFGSIDTAMNGIRQVADAVSTDVLAILGNHDSIEMVPALESMGIRVLMNEHAVIEKGSSSMIFAGVDDPNYYRLDSIEQIVKNAPDLKSNASILLAHSPDIYTTAADAGFSAYLCGHTHGGQICVLPGKSLFKNFRSPGWTLAGAWQHNHMLGYTSPGVGTSVVNARFNCKPELTLHELRR